MVRYPHITAVPKGVVELRVYKNRCTFKEYYVSIQHGHLASGVSNKGILVDLFGKKENYIKELTTLYGHTPSSGSWPMWDSRKVPADFGIKVFNWLIDAVNNHNAKIDGTGSFFVDNDPIVRLKIGELSIEHDFASLGLLHNCMHLLQPSFSTSGVIKGRSRFYTADIKNQCWTYSDTSSTNPHISLNEVAKLLGLEETTPLDFDTIQQQLKAGELWINFDKTKDDLKSLHECLIALGALAIGIVEGMSERYTVVDKSIRFSNNWRPSISLGIACKALGIHKTPELLKQLQNGDLWICFDRHTENLEALQECLLKLSKNPAGHRKVIHELVGSYSYYRTEAAYGYLGAPNIPDNQSISLEKACELLGISYTKKSIGNLAPTELFNSTDFTSTPTITTTLTLIEDDDCLLKPFILPSFKITNLNS